MTLGSTSGQSIAFPKTIYGCGHNDGDTLNENGSGIIGLGAIAVDNDRLEFTCSSFGTTEGNIIIDSGTTLTVLPQEFYLKLETLVVSEIDSKRVDAPAETLSRWYEAQNDFKVPNITVRFTNADVKLSPLNTFVLVSESVSCFSFTTISDFSIYGNLAQMNFLVGYDIENQAASFKPTACTKE
ncbi:hypothetical protein SCA6_002737 [Theobroma cacao]